MLAVALLLLTAGAQLPARELGPALPTLAELGEGALDNDVFQPVATAAQDHLARGDEALAALKLRSTAPADERTWIEVLEHWSAALGACAPGDAVVPRPWRAAQGLDSPWPDPDGTAGGGASDRPARRTEAIEYAVLRRLASLAPAQRELWNARVGALAAEALVGARTSTPQLTALESRYPGTRAAALAGMARAEQEFEAGRPTFARGWLERAARHAEVAGAQDVLAAIARRRSAPGLALGSESATAKSETWRSARSLRFLAEVQLENLSERTQVYLPRPGQHGESGMVGLADGSVLVQTFKGAIVLDAADGRRRALIDPFELLARAGVAVELEDPPRAAPGWPALPAAAQGRCVLVLRSQPPALLCFTLEPAQMYEGLREARLEWARVGVHLFDGQGRPAEGDRALWPDGEAQPGPLVFDDRLCVAVQTDDETGRRAAHLVALDLASGSVEWSRLVARGVHLQRGGLRFLSAAPQPGASQPLTRCGERVLFGTHLGATALIEPLDGRIAWSLATRRRPAEEDGWSGTRAATFEEPRGLLLAPADSDRLYGLLGEPDLAGRGLFLWPPLPKDQALVLMGGTAGSAVLLSRSGRERVLSEWRLAEGERWEAPWLSPGEAFTGHGAVSGERVIFATDRAVYLHDRGRELYLLEQVPYPREFVGSGGSVYAQGDRVWILGPHLAWLLVAR